MNNSHIIKEIAKTVGFDLCGITTADVIPEAKAHYIEWLKRGYQADMKYLENVERRTDPRAVVPNAKSVIMLALNYYSEKLPEQENFKIARYARGRDYHKYMAKLLKRYTLELKQQFPEEEFRFYVDYGPFLERSYAERAGIGFIGKNGMIITKEFGSWVLLCEVITTMKLEPDTPARRTCGTCTRCLDGCPTGALLPDNFLDANKCTSFHTIENKSPVIPEPIRANMKGWSFGCDICQEVCPFNNPYRLKETTHEEFNPRYTGFSPEDSAFTSEEKFLEKYQATPIMRAKRHGIIRNIHANLPKNSTFVLPQVSKVWENRDEEINFSDIMNDTQQQSNESNKQEWAMDINTSLVADTIFALGKLSGILQTITVPKQFVFLFLTKEVLSTTASTEESLEKTLETKGKEIQRAVTALNSTFVELYRNPSLGNAIFLEKQIEKISSESLEVNTTLHEIEEMTITQNTLYSVCDEAYKLKAYEKYFSFLLPLLLFSKKLTFSPIFLWKADNKVQPSTKEEWIKIFLENLKNSSEYTTQTSLAIEEIFKKVSLQMQDLGRGKEKGTQILETLIQYPIIRLRDAMNLTKLTKPNAHLLLQKFVDAKILSISNLKKKGRAYLWSELINILKL